MNSKLTVAMQDVLNLLPDGFAKRMVYIAFLFAQLRMNNDGDENI